MDVYDQAGNVWYIRARIGQRYYYPGEKSYRLVSRENRRELFGKGPYIEVIYGDESVHKRLRLEEDDR
ncbi:hypothetical protein PBI_MONET_60 [Mycobacterium phage Monet]|nr:hypothetical protein PBI_MONET_60 [Mycobacterium phage Monet]